VQSEQYETKVGNLCTYCSNSDDDCNEQPTAASDVQNTTQIEQDFPQGDSNTVTENKV